MKSLGVLTTIEANHGSSIFNFSLNSILKKGLPSYHVRFLKYDAPGRFLYERLRAIKPNRQIPAYNFQRYQRLMQFEHKHLDLDPLPTIATYRTLIRKLIKKKYDALVVAKVVWDFSRTWYVQKFPSIFWLSEDIPAIKIGYAVSGHRTDMSLLQKYKDTVNRILSSYSLIGVRDDLTMDMMSEAGVTDRVKVVKVPDPAFMYQPVSINVRNLLKKYGIHDQKPILGLLLYGKPEISRAICRRYRKKGYTIISFNMYNPFVDVNLGHRVGPFEWAEIFRLLNVCVTDRFHCSVLCIKNQAPFMAVEPYPPKVLGQSKIYDLLKEFDLRECYCNPFLSNFDLQAFVSTCEEIESGWEKEFKGPVKKKCDRARQKHRDFFSLVQKIL